MIQERINVKFMLIGIKKVSKNYENKVINLIKFIIHYSNFNMKFKELFPAIFFIKKVYKTQSYNFKNNMPIMLRNLYYFWGSIELLIISHLRIYMSDLNLINFCDFQMTTDILYERLFDIRQIIINELFESSFREKEEIEILLENREFVFLKLNYYIYELVRFIIQLLFTAICEPIFVIEDYNFAFRINSSIDRSIVKLLNFRVQTLYMLIRGNILIRLGDLGFNKFIGIVKRYISDLKFIGIIDRIFRIEMTRLNQAQEVAQISLIQLEKLNFSLFLSLFFNIYIYDFDNFINKNISLKFGKVNKTIKFRSKFFLKQKNLYVLKRKGNTFLGLKGRACEYINYSSKEIKYLEKLKRCRNRRIFSELTFKNFSHLELRFVYFRHLGSFILFSNFSIRICNELVYLMGRYLIQKLDLVLNHGKLKIINLRYKSFDFLGFSLYMASLRSISQRIKKIQNLSLIKSVVDPKMRYEQLLQKGYVKFKRNKMVPSNVYYLTYFTECEIVNYFSQVMQGLTNYYFRLTSNKLQIVNILYFLYYSCIFTIASKRRSSTYKFYNHSWKEYNSQFQLIGSNKLVIGKSSKYRFKRENIIGFVKLPSYKDIIIKSFFFVFNINAKLYDFAVIISSKNYKYVPHYKIIVNNYKKSSFKVCSKYKINLGSRNNFRKFVMVPRYLSIKSLNYNF